MQITYRSGFPSREYRVHVGPAAGDRFVER